MLCLRNLGQRPVKSFIVQYYHLVVGEGNGTPLQHSCLENPMNGGAWWAAVHGVAQSRTRLKRLSSSSRDNKPFCFLQWQTCFSEESFHLTLLLPGVFTCLVSSESLLKSHLNKKDFSDYHSMKTMQQT